jgi:phosphomannomutase
MNQQTTYLRGTGEKRRSLTIVPRRAVRSGPDFEFLAMTSIPFATRTRMYAALTRERDLTLKFGTSGLRGLATELAGKPATIYATAFARHLLDTGKATPGDTVLIGRDFRDSSPAIAAACAAALSRAGLQPVDCGTLPTPALALYGLKTGAASLMITGSHIPADRNGIKFYLPSGEIDKHDEAAISALAAKVEAEDFTAPADVEMEHAGERAVAVFFDRNRALLSPGTLSGMTIGVYQHSTVARDLLADLLEQYGATVKRLGRSETFIPVDTEAVSAETIDKLKTWARAEKLDAIVSADGDGDRPLVADETGTPLRGDLLGLIAAGFLGAKVVVTPVTSNSGIEGAGRYEVVRTRVGSPYVIAGMLDALADGKDGVMGFEANGGLLTASPFLLNGRTLNPLPTRDCFVPILACLARAATSGQSLSAVAADYRLPVAAADRLENFAQERSAALMQHLRASRENLAGFLADIGEVESTSDIDGLRVSLKDGRTIHFRPSGNAPEMRCYVEAGSEEAASALLVKGLRTIRAFAAASP